MLGLKVAFAETLSTSSAHTIFDSLTDTMGDYILDLIVYVIPFAIAVWGIVLVSRKAWGYVRGL